jgi:hypothetical protein
VKELYLTMFDEMRLARAEELRRARRDPNDKDATMLEALVEKKMAAREAGSMKTEDWL